MILLENASSWKIILALGDVLLLPLITPRAISNFLRHDFLFTSRWKLVLAGEMEHTGGKTVMPYYRERDYDPGLINNFRGTFYDK